MDWLAKMLGLPDKFLHHHPDSVGGGVLQVGEIRDGLINVCFQVNFSLGDSFSRGKTNKIFYMALIPNLALFSQILLLSVVDYRIETAVAFSAVLWTNSRYSCGLFKDK